MGALDYKQVFYISFVLGQIWEAGKDKFFRNLNPKGVDVLRKIHIEFEEWIKSLMDINIYKIQIILKMPMIK